METYSLFINGEFIPAAAGETFESVNPFNGELTGVFARGQAADVDKAVKAARKAFDEGPWPRMTGLERQAVMLQIADKLEAHAKELTAMEIADSGSTFRKAKGDLWNCNKHFRYFVDLAANDLSEPLDALSHQGVSNNRIYREPIGVCAQIIPWNFPLQMAIWKLGPALAAGNTVVLKPAEETPLSAMAFAKLLAETDLPPGVINIVTGFGKEAGEALATHPLVDKIAFTGSTEIGKHIMACAAPGMKKVTLECGGKSANIVLDDADLPMAVDGSLFAIFFHQGQCCTAGSRLFLQDGIYDEFMTRFLDKARQIKLGDPADKATDMGPLVSKKQQERVLKYIETGKKEGAECILGGNIPQDASLAKGCFVEPTVFVNVDNTMAIAREEIFGPVLVVQRFKTLDEVIQKANDSIYGLAGAVWSQDAEKALRVAKALRTGTVWINEYHLVSEKAPFGGYKQSGIGRELGLEGLKEYTEIKHIHVDEIGERQKKFWYDSVLASPKPVAAG